MEGPVSLCWYFFGILNLLSLLSPLLTCHTVCSPNRRTDMVKMLLATNNGYSIHSRKLSRECFLNHLLIMVCFTETAPQKPYTELAYLEKSHKQKERMRENGGRWRKAMRQVRNDHKLWVGLFQDDVVKQLNIPTRNVNNNDFHHGTRDTLAKKSNCFV